MSSRIIINNKTSLTDLQAVRLVYTVVSGGLVSNDETQYCYITRFEVGDADKRSVIVSCDVTRTCGFTFTIMDDAVKSA